MTEHPSDLSLGGHDNAPQGSGGSALQPRLEQAMAHLCAMGWSPQAGPALVVLGREQRLFGLGEGFPLGGWSVSTGLAGFGNEADSGRTPTGLHRICACIGDGAPPGMVFKSREPTGEIVTAIEQPGMDCITTRILWLEGMEEGINRGPGVDSRSRYIYIHGTPDIHRLGQPVSAGCVRMNNEDIITLFARVSDQTPVLILP